MMQIPLSPSSVHPALERGKHCRTVNQKSFPQMGGGSIHQRIAQGGISIALPKRR
jgi:hypothetical protein